jgi:predicted enzyme related to lactoylglutathione lyase
MSKVTHFELPADDPKRAIAFYEKVFGWTITKWEGPFDYWLVTIGSDDEPGINGAITPRMMPEQVTTDTIGVESLDDSLKKIVEAGGTITQPKQAVPGVGYIAYCSDTEGNLFGLIQTDMSGCMTPNRFPSVSVQ